MGNRGRSILVALILIASGCAGGHNAAGPVPDQLVSISVSPANSSLAMNTGQQFIATGLYSDNTKKDITGQVEWTSSDPAVAAVNNGTGTAGSGLSSAVFGAAATSGTAGYVYAKTEGTATIKASWGKLWGSGDLNVKRASLVSIAVTPTNPAIVKGTGQQFTAVGTFSDNTTQDITAGVLWASSNASIATISNTAGSIGLATSLAAGTTTITATTGTISGSATLTVNTARLISIAVTPTNPALPAGTGRQFTATGTFSDNTTQDLTASASWTSSDTAVATVSSTGFAAAVAAGSATITASSGGISGSTVLTVTPATLLSLAITPLNPAIAKGTSQQFTATGTFSDGSTQNMTAAVTWSSSNPAVATISNAAGSSGLAASVAAGSTTISAASGSITASTTLTVNQATLASLAVTPANPAIAKGTNQQFSATGTYSDGSTQNVTAAVTWSSSSTAVATISNAAGSSGLATSVAAGSTTIRAVSGTVSASTTLTVNPATLASLAVSPLNTGISVRGTKQFSATGTYSDGTTQNLTSAVTWSSSNASVATISNAAGSNGLATGVAVGSTTIRALSGSLSAATTLTVSDRSATLTWDAPTTNTDGTALTDLTGYKIYYGTAPGTYTTTLSTGTATTFVVNNLAPGTYYFSVTAVNSAGTESVFSNEMSKTIQ